MKPRWLLIALLVLSHGLRAQVVPRVSIVSPAAGTTLADNLFTLVAEVQSDDGIAVEVRFFVDGIYYGSAFQPPYALPVFVPNGRHAIQASASNELRYVTFSPRIVIQVGEEYPVNLTRGPYLQSMSSTSVVVRWRTDWPTNSIVYFESGGLGSFSATNPVRSAEHEVLVTGLVPNTHYDYAIASGTEMFAEGGALVFRTAPTNTQPVTVWVIGDAGQATTNTAAVRDGYLNVFGPANTDLWLMLGDNAYESGTDDEYERAVFEMYPGILPRVPLWPTLGNHDASSPGSPGEFPYFDMFNFPTNGEAGGVPSGTEKYYSFDYANVHFICLDSQSSSRAFDGPMLSWLREDLAATEKDWIVAYWHHPPYSKGTHDSDSELQLIEMRERALPILESYGADLVLSGHSHVYERSYFINGHYGKTNSFKQWMKIDGGFGDTLENPYRKPAGGLGANRGTVYAVCGCSGEGGPWNYPWGIHPAMARSLNGFGSMILRFDGLKLEARFLRPIGTFDDYFIIDKSAPASVRPELKIARSVEGAELSWPTSIPAYSIETAAAVPNGPAWQTATGALRRVGRRNVINMPFDQSSRFFRLHAE